MAKTSKLELIMELSDKLFNNKLSQVQAKLGAATDSMDAKLTKLSGGHVKMAAGVGAAFAAIGGIAAITATIDKSAEAAQKFDSAFLPIRQLNLDKSKSEMDSYRNMVRDSAYEVGTSLEASTNAYYDLQSATGMYGKDAEKVFKMVANYSVATGANLGDAMNSTTKAMKAYGLGVKDIDALLVSNAKTVQVGITTFDELARVQTDYAGSVSAAGQNFDTGNKVFAMFTSVAKSADIAANMTKTFFDGLGSQSDKIKENLGIDVFDVKGNMKDADKLLVEISEKFKGMSDNQITSIINKIGGPEGLRGALAKVKTGADDMIATFNAFDSSKFSLADALKNAQGDYGKMKELFYNRLEIVFSKIGEKILPILANVFDKLTPMLNWLFQNVDWLIPAVGTFVSVLATLTAGVWLFNIAMAANPIGLMVIGIALLSGAIAVGIAKFDEWGALLLYLMGPIGRIVAAFKLIYDHWDSIVQAFKSDGIIAGLSRIGVVLFDVVLKPLQQLLQLIAKIPGIGSIAGDAAKEVEAFRNSLDLVTPGEKEAKLKKGQPDSLNSTPALSKAPATNTKTGGKNNKKTGENISKVAGQANQVRNITIQIDSFNKGGINVAQSAYAGMKKEDVEAWFKEMLRRVVINAETA